MLLKPNDKIVSVSRLTTLMNCSLKYAFKYKYHLPEEDKYYLTRGRIFHNSLQYFLNNRNSATENDIHEFIDSEFSLAKNSGEPVTDTRVTEKYVLGTIKNAATKFIKYNSNLKDFTLFEYNSPEGKKKTTEVEFKVPFVDLDTMNSYNLEYELYGFMDLISYDSEYGIVISDHKLHSKPYNDFQVQTDLQLSLYAYAFKYLVKTGVIDISGYQLDDKINVAFNSHQLASRFFNAKSEPKINLTIYKASVSDRNIAGTLNIVRDLIYNESKMKFVPNYNDECNWKCGFNEACLLYRKGFDIKKYAELRIKEAESNKIRSTIDPINEELAF